MEMLFLAVPMALLWTDGISEHSKAVKANTFKKKKSPLSSFLLLSLFLSFVRNFRLEINNISRPLSLALTRNFIIFQLQIIFLTGSYTHLS